MERAIGSEIRELTDEELNLATGAGRIGPFSAKLDEGVVALGIDGVVSVAIDLSRGGSWGNFMGFSWNF